MKKARLVLEDGTVYFGYSFGAEKCTNGEVVFNTGMVGYPESLTDPSYHGQILSLTYPLIGNYGIPGNEKENGLFKNFESEKIQISALIVSEYEKKYFHWSAIKSISDWLKEYKIPAICDIDTRALTKKLRSQGTMLGKIIVNKKTDPGFDDPNNRNLVAEVSVSAKLRIHGYALRANRDLLHRTRLESDARFVDRKPGLERLDDVHGDAGYRAANIVPFARRADPERRMG